MELRKFVAPECIFGNGSRYQTGAAIQKLGARRVLVVSDPGVIAAGWTAHVIQSLEERGISYTLYSDVSPNPRDAQVMAGAFLYKENQCDAIVVVGGGSPIDCAKGIGIVAANGGNILQYEGVDQIANAIPPLICIPTTAGSAADVSQFAIITDVSNKNKIAIISKTIVPDVALIDPETTTSMDPFLTACTGMDTLTHAVEAFVSNAHSPLTDVHAEKGIQLIHTHLRETIHNPLDLNLREKISFGCLEAGLAFSNASLGAVHAMAHSLGGFKDLPHGECNALLLDHVIEFNHNAVPARFRRVAELLDIDHRGMNDIEVKQSTLSSIRTLRKDVGISVSLGDLGVRTADIPELSEKAVNDPCLLTNPRDAEQRDIEVIYEEAL